MVGPRHSGRGNDRFVRMVFGFENSNAELEFVSLVVDFRLINTFGVRRATNSAHSHPNTNGNSLLCRLLVLLLLYYPTYELDIESTATHPLHPNSFQAVPAAPVADPITHPIFGVDPNAGVQPQQQQPMMGMMAPQQQQGYGVNIV